MAVNGNFYYYSLCHYCKNILVKYQRCTSCKSISYCSQEHQLLDWKAHRKLCKAIALARLQHVYNGSSFEEWKRYRVHCQLLWKHNLKRDLLPFEYQMWMFPRVCSVCYSEDNLNDCHKCCNVAYCGDKHKQQHSSIHNKFCGLLKLCMEIDRYLAIGNSYPTININMLVKYLRNAQNMQELIELFHGSPSGTIESVLKSDAISPSAIIYNAMQFAHLEKCKEIVIHIVGSSSTEATIDWSLVSEVIFHSTPNLQKIIFIIIGPEAWLLSSDFNLCSVCSDSGKTISLKVLVNLYHEVVDDIAAPNLVVAFNCGLHEHEHQNNDEWKESLSALIKYRGIPLAFTSYTKDELVKDGDRLKNLGFQLKFLYWGKNRFASLRPLRDWAIMDKPIFYSHGYMGIVMQSDL